MRGEQAKARRFIVSGMVQGVGYRIFAVGAASRAGVSGFVRNLREGTVEVYAIGDDVQLSAMRRELEAGPRFASVDKVLEEDAPVDKRYAHDFQIERDY